MHIRCPHCRNPIEVVDDETIYEIDCPSCGSHFSLLGGDTTVTHRRPLPPPIGHFEFREKLGEGAFGTVWRAYDNELQRDVAIKIPRREQFEGSHGEDFLREARATAQLRHPNIVAVYEVGRHNDFLYIVSDYIDGQPLSRWMLGHEIAPTQAAQLCHTILLAIHHAHERGVIHRDLKPSNILMDAPGTPHITDFGLAKREAGEITVTVDGKILGTPAYMSPEQARGESSQVDRRSDVYAVGVILYELLVGRRPFQGNAEMLLHQLLHEAPTAPHRVRRGVPRDIETICLKALDKLPARRYATAAEMAADLERFIQRMPIRARRANPVQRLYRWGQRHPARVLVGALLAVTAFLLILLASKPPPNETPASPAVTATPQPLNKQTVRLQTDPPDASVVFIPLNEYGEPQPQLKVTAEAPSEGEIELEPGDYLVVAYIDDDMFHEVFRRVPAAAGGLGGTYRHESWEVDEQGAVVLPAVRLHSTRSLPRLAFIKGGEFLMGLPNDPTIPSHRRRVPDYYFAEHEVTLDEFRAFSQGAIPLGYGDDVPAGDHAAAFISYDEAVALAERAGMRLPCEVEYEYAATVRGTARFPWGDDPGPTATWQLGPPSASAHDQLATEPPVVGLYSNIAIWTSSQLTLYPAQRMIGLPQSASSIERVIRGGPLSVVGGNPDPNDTVEGPCARRGMVRQRRLPGLGVRLARSAKPRLTAADFTAVLDAP